MRAFAGLPARLDLGPGGFLVFDVVAVVGDDLAALVGLDQEQRVDGARADRVIRHLERRAHQRQALAARGEEVERGAGRAHLEQRPREGEESVAIEIELNEAPVVAIAQRRRVERGEALQVAPSPHRDHLAPGVRRGVFESLDTRPDYARSSRVGAIFRRRIEGR